MIIRRAGKDDIDRIAELEILCFHDPWSREMVAAEFSGINDTRYFGAEMDRQLIGYAGVWLVPPEGYITNVAVHPDFRRRGVAWQMLKSLFEACAGEGISDYTLEVRVSNEAAITLYKELGFETQGIRKRYYADGEDALIMWKHADPVPDTDR